MRVRSEGYVLFRGWEFSKVCIATEGKGGGARQKLHVFCVHTLWTTLKCISVFFL